METTACMEENREALMQKLQEIGLTLADLTEYLDTHVHDSFAIQRHNTAAAEYQEVLARFEQLFGPLTLGAQNGEAGRWMWALQDFPWDYEL